MSLSNIVQSQIVHYLLNSSYFNESGKCDYTTEFDVSGNGNDAKINGTVNAADGGNTCVSAYNLDSKTTIVGTIKSPTALTALSASCWVNFSNITFATDQTMARIFELHSLSSDLSIELSVGSSASPIVTLFNGTVTVATLTSSSSLNGWHLIVVSYNAGRCCFYIDNRCDSTKTLSTVYKCTLGNVNIGCSNGNNVSGIYDLRVLNIELSNNDVLRIYGVKASVDNESNLVTGFFQESNDGSSSIRRTMSSVTNEYIERETFDNGSSGRFSAKNMTFKQFVEV